MKKKKLLNLYSGIGGNRKLWGDEYEVTAVELNPEIAAIYKNLFPNDTVIVGDAHEYLLKHFKEFDFIWGSPPCPSHSRARFWGCQDNPIYPDMALYQEILFLKHYFKGLWIIENVIPFYEPIIKPSFEIERHFVWCNFFIPSFEYDKIDNYGKQKDDALFLSRTYGYELSQLKGVDKQKVLRNCVIPEMGLHILNAAMKKKSPSDNKAKQEVLFEYVN